MCIVPVSRIDALSMSTGNCGKPVPHTNCHQLRRSASLFRLRMTLECLHSGLSKIPSFRPLMFLMMIVSLSRPTMLYSMEAAFHPGLGLSKLRIMSNMVPNLTFHTFLPMEPLIGLSLCTVLCRPTGLPTLRKKGLWFTCKLGLSTTLPSRA